MSKEVINNNMSTSFVQYDEYWLQKARQLIDNSVEVFTKRLKSLNDFLDYLAAGTFLGFTGFAVYLKSSEPTVYWLVVIPLVAVAAAKWFVNVQGTQIALEETHMRSPSAINEYYTNMVVILSKQVRNAAIVVAGATLLSLALVPWAVYFHNRLSEIKIPDSYVHISYDDEKVEASGLLPKVDNIYLIMFGKKKGTDTISDPLYTSILQKKDSSLSTVLYLEELEIDLDSIMLQYQVGEKWHHYIHKKRDMELFKCEKVIKNDPIGTSETGEGG